jgi:uncharacterized integral membrane protein (TIGR00698 family)
MDSSSRSIKSLVPGIALVALLSIIATWAAGSPLLTSWRIGPLIVGLLLGVVVGNAASDRLPPNLDDGILFSAKKILRLAIILYGFRITFAQVASVGAAGIALDLFMVSSTLILGCFLGTRWLGIDKETAILTSAGAAICGAAAVVATEPLVKSERHQTAMAVATVVIFGTLAMVLYPMVYRSGIVPLSEEAFGVYIGASLHGVAHAVAASDAVGPQAANVAIIVKMTRVLMLAPALLVISWWLSRSPQADGSKAPITIPWFAVGFLLVACLNSLELLPQTLVDQLIAVDKFLLTMAMTGLGLGTVLSKFSRLGAGPFKLALALFVWLIIAGFTGSYMISSV